MKIESISYIYINITNHTTMDPHSYANFHEVIATHYALNLHTDFTRKILYGYVDISVKVVGPSANYLYLDIKALAIERVTDQKTGKDFKWTIPKNNTFGSMLDIDLPLDKMIQGTEFTVRVRYSTTPESGAIQWLEPSQTAGKRYPYCYTQCEAIHARSLVPCQDTPAVKAPYTIKISCPPPLVAACSGIPVHQQPILEDDGCVSYSFEQKNPIPTYLIALVVGKLQKGKVGPRSSVYTEQEYLSKAIYEFSEDTENYICAAEEITGVKYDWGVYDIVVLPSAFPYGGMENPNLNFLSASLLAGDRSLTNVVAHEVTHSWSGNYVTNSSWKDFWLNEGFTVYIERMILGKVTKSKQYRYFEMLCGYNDLKKTIADLKDHPEFTKLRPDLTGTSPDEAFSKVPYEKGSLFLFYLETKVGGETAMQKWLNSYFTTFRNTSITTEQMKEHFLKHFSGLDLGSIDWDTWLYAPGLPPFDPTSVLDTTLTTKCSALSEKWIKCKPISADGSMATTNDLKDFRPKQIMFFLDGIILGGGLPHDALERMESLYELSQSKNVEIQFRWLQLCLKSKYLRVIPDVADFLSKHGRGLYVKPLYKMLHSVDHPAAVKIYHANRPYYHSVIRTAFDKDLEYQ